MDKNGNCHYNSFTNNIDCIRPARFPEEEIDINGNCHYKIGDNVVISCSVMFPEDI